MADCKRAPTRWNILSSPELRVLHVLSARSLRALERTDFDLWSYASFEVPGARRGWLFPRSAVGSNWNLNSWLQGGRRVHQLTGEILLATRPELSYVGCALVRRIESK